MESRIRPERALVHPAWWLSLAILALNDHLLKGAGLLPELVTGKLSDLVGMMVAPALFAVVVRARSDRALLACHAAVGVVFAAIQVSAGAASLVSDATALLGARWLIVSDPSDLVALPVLALSWRTLRPAMLADERFARRGAERLLAAVGLFFCIATSAVNECEEAGTCGCTDNDGDGACAEVDCNDNDPSIVTGCCIDADGDGVCADADCDDNDPNEWSHCCTDADGDGVCATFDCDDSDPNLWDCCIDADGDGVCADDDCDDSDPNVFDCSCGGTLPLAVGEQVGDTSQGWHSRYLSCAETGAGLLGQYDVTGEGLRWLTLTLESETPHALAVAGDCDFETTLACLAPATSHEASLLSASKASIFVYLTPVTQGEAGPFTLLLRDEPLSCGDGLVVGPEECDDGNQNDGDGCDASCKLE